MSTRVDGAHGRRRLSAFRMRYTLGALPAAAGAVFAASLDRRAAAANGDRKLGRDAVRVFIPLGLPMTRYPAITFRIAIEPVRNGESS
jgi:hypothetical protein